MDKIFFQGDCGALGEQAMRALAAKGYGYGAWSPLGGLMRDARCRALRRAKVCDLPAIMDIERACFGETQSQWSEQDMRSQFDHDFATVTVFDEEEEGGDDSSLPTVVGFLLSWQAGNEFQVMRLGVEPARQGKGIGSKLMFDLLRDADVRTRGEEEEEGVVTLEVRESNRKAKSFYRKLGFEPVATRSSYYSNGEDATIMELQLLKPKTLN